MGDVIIVGLGKSGIESARLLAREGHHVFITEIRDDETKFNIIKNLIKEGVVKEGDVELGRHTRRFIEKADFMIISPGIGVDALPVRLAKERGLPVISEIELGYRSCRCPIIAVTGTSGKTTVTTLIGRVLKNAGFDTIVCGNIGNPFTGEVHRVKNDSIVVLEVSSFQLEWVKDFKPKIAIILNISPNHLDRHKDMEEYISLKSRIFAKQDDNDVLFLNGRDEMVRGLARKASSHVEFFDEYMDLEKRFSIHNEDYLAVMAVCHTMGVPVDKILAVIRDFKGIEHRLEYVDTINGITFINDSKATTVSSVEWALKSLSGRLVLIMGGRYKGGDFGALRGLISEKVDFIIAIGEARPHIVGALNGIVDIYEAIDLSDAVERGFKIARMGATILLSPGCSSFDMFKNYEERGKTFKEIVKRLKASYSS